MYEATTSTKNTMYEATTSTMNARDQILVIFVATAS
jgi:hypothetical protein